MFIRRLLVITLVALSLLPSSGAGAEPLPAELRAAVGQVAVVHFWASWCGPCRTELPLVDGLSARLAGSGAVVVAVSVDTQQRAAEALAQRLGLALPLIYDTQGVVARRFDPPAMPTTVLLDRSGAVRRVLSGAMDEAATRTLEAEARALAAARP